MMRHALTLAALAIVSMAAGCSGSVRSRSEPTHSTTLLRAGWYVVRLEKGTETLVIVLINEGPTTLELAQIVINRADDGGWVYTGAVRMAPGAVRVLDVDRFNTAGKPRKFHCRLPVSLEGTLAGGGTVSAHGLPSSPSALSSQIRDCSREHPS